MAASRLATHDSGPGWLATPFLYDSFIHNSAPVCTGALRILLSQHAAASEPRRGPADPRVFVCCLLPSPRHDRLGPLKHLSADTMTWLQRSLSLRPAGLLSACSGLSTPRSARSDLSFRLGSATGCSSACPGRSFTCKKYASSSGRAM